MKPGAVALVSGGIESLCLMRTLLAEGRAVVPLYVRCGLRWEEAELYWLTRWLPVVGHRRPCYANASQRPLRSARREGRLRPVSVLAVPLRDLYRTHWSVTGRGVPGQATRDTAVYLPGRNVLLLSYAAIYGAQRGIGRLALGTLRGNPFGDATPRFFRQLEKSLQHAVGQPIQIMAPLRRLTKSQMLGSMPHQPWHLTFSCLQPRGRLHCGWCNKCAERRRAFRQAGLPDPTDYATS